MLHLDAADPHAPDFTLSTGQLVMVILVLVLFGFVIGRVTR